MPPPEALADVDRLVLLGDIVELRRGLLRDALAEASGILRSVSEILGAGREVVLVPGNHDHELLASWFARRAAGGPPSPLGLAAEVDWLAGEPLAAVAGMLAAGGASISVRYPGVWLRDDVYATHGHYLDRHTTVPMFERLGAGAMARLLRAPVADACRPEDYERVLAPIYAWIHAVANAGGPEVGHSAHGGSSRVWQAIGTARRGAGVGAALRSGFLRAGVGSAVAALNRGGLGPLSPDLRGDALRTAALRAFGEVLAALEVEARHAIFGHTHRAGPLPGDDAGEWTALSGTRLHNTGCWVHEPAFLGSDPARSPYRAGFAVRLGYSGPPELVNLLD